jgi:uncharacterized protein YjbJ (UPF0337 family)
VRTCGRDRTGAVALGSVASCVLILEVSADVRHERSTTMGSGTSDKIKGKANEIVGTVTGNRKREAKGKAQEVKGGITDKLEEKNRELEEEDEAQD